MAKQSHAFRAIEDPFGGEHVFAVRAIPVDVAIVVVQQCDENGNAHLWGNLGTTLESVRAAKRTIVIAEEMVDADRIRRHPNRTHIPGFLVDAVVIEHGAAHPSPVEGYEERDHAAFEQYHRATRTVEGWQEWRKSCIDECPDRTAYLRKFRP